MSANVSPRRVCSQVLASPVGQWTQHRLAFDCGQRGCWGERTLDLAGVAAKLGNEVTVGDVVLRLRCTSCGRKPRAVHLETGPRLATHTASGFRRVMLTGLSPVENGR